MSNILNPNAAGIDIASKEHFVAVPQDRCQESVRCFESFTKDLHQIASWLKQCRIETIAMESTGIYWYHLYTVLQDYGFEVFLVNAYHVKNVPGRKSDVSDARWLQQLHCYGLLNGCFQPDNLTRTLRNYVRQRKHIIKQMGRETQRMQKSLEQMNIKLNNVLRDINGKTGRTIIEKILQGERNAEELVKYRESGIKASRETFIKSLEGNWREEQIFNLLQAYDHYHFLQSQLEQCDKKSEEVVIQMADSSIPKKEVPKVRRQKNQPFFEVEQHLYNALGVDVTAIFGVKVITALTVFSETGSNLKEKFPTPKQFLSWLNVVPDNKISGGKIISSKVKRKKNTGQAFRDAASSLWRAQNPLGDYLRRKKAKSGTRQAVVATARKIASIYYKMVTDKVEFNSDKLKEKTEKYLKRKVEYLERKNLEINNLIVKNQIVKNLVI